jgi:hypothetical protein
LPVLSLRPPLCALLLIGAIASGLAVTLRHASASMIVGNAATVVREVRGALEAVNRVLVVDSELSQDEEVTTGPGSATRILFKDGTNLEMGENSRLKLTKLVFDADPNKSRVAIKAVIGVFRWSSGTLPSSAYSIATPVATIGIRGTTLEFIVGESGLTTVALTRGEVIVSNTHGESVILHPGDATTVEPPDPDGSQASPTAPGGLPPNARDQIMKMTRTVRVNEVQGINPGAGSDGDSSGNAGSGPGKSGIINPAGLPPGSSPTSGPGTTSGGNPSTASNDGPPFSSPPTVNFTPILTSTGGAPGGSGTPPTKRTTSAPSGGGTTPPPPVATDMGTIEWQLVVDGTTRTAELRIRLANGRSVTLTSVTQKGAQQQFAITNIPLNAPLSGDPLLGFLTFEPLPGDVGLFDGEVTFTDAEGDTWIWHYSGAAEALAAVIAEPRMLLLFGAALGGFFVMRRHRKA